ncbi:CMP/dCMP deaminase [Artemisia annua]|uniref:CMP/dCMP deaminase n=1 Tax=Artemisia annua TaxID=35608 RepID=A0A2U1P4F9_ARTAN|nr:CMP/dCMP deaminase [Artemisia annua]
MFGDNKLLENQDLKGAYAIQVEALLKQQQGGVPIVPHLLEANRKLEHVTLEYEPNSVDTKYGSENHLAPPDSKLQARIDTVVWGAPNKLLDADASWVRQVHQALKMQDLQREPNGNGNFGHVYIARKRRYFQLSGALFIAAQESGSATNITDFGTWIELLFYIYGVGNNKENAHTSYKVMLCTL